MRGFELQDTFKLSEILDKMDVQADLNAILDKSKSKEYKNQREAQAFVGGQIGLILIKKLYKAEKQIIEFVSSFTGESVETVKKYKPKEIKKFIEELISNEDFTDFFQQVED
ncbi:MAG: hypothetical protein E7211_14295 [Clostridium lundense]|nr:hypothetical protein [Clostridium lundense]